MYAKAPRCACICTRGALLMIFQIICFSLLRSICNLGVKAFLCRTYTVSESLRLPLPESLV